MDDLESLNYHDELSKAIEALQTLEKERKDIVLGFIKGKEITEKIHNEHLQQLRQNYDKEIEALKEEFINEKENLLSKTRSEQVEYNALQKEKAKESEIASAKKSEQEIKDINESFRNEKRKLREEYESVIKQKTNEIEELYTENYILRAKSDPQSFEDKYKDAKIQINILKSEINGLKENLSDEIQRLKVESDFERSELERKHVLEKAEFVKNLNTKFDEQQKHNEIEKNKTYKEYRNELKEKIEIVEQLWEDRSAEERLKMNMRFEKEISELKARFAQDLEDKLIERDSTITSLEIEKDQLLNAIHVERFELAKFYNRELSLLNRLDSTKEDIEVALIDEVAKLRDEQQKVIHNMEKRHKRKLNDLKKKQKPLEEILEQHKNDLDDLKSQYEREREEFEAQLRNEQLVLLKSFEFEKNDIERYYKQVIEDREKEFKDEIEKIQNEHKKEIEQMGTLEKENNEIKEQLSRLNDKNNELVDKIELFESQNARLQEELEKENRSKRDRPDKLEESPSDLKRTMEELGKSNIDLASQLQKAQKKCEELLQRTHELESLHQDSLEKTVKEEIEKPLAAEGYMMSSIDDGKGQMDINDSNRFDNHQNAAQKDQANEAIHLQGKSPEDKDIELQNNVQEYLIELKALQETLDSKDTEMKELKEENERENKQLKKAMKDLRDAINDALDGDETEEEDLDVLKSRHKLIKDIINQEIKDTQGLKERDRKEQMPNIDSDTSANNFIANVNALDGIMKAFDDNESQQVKDRLADVKEQILISHEIEIFECQQKHEKEKIKYLKELADEKEAEAKLSEKLLQAVCEEVGVQKNEMKDKVKESESQSKDEDSLKEGQSKESFDNTGDNGQEEIERLKTDKEELEIAIVELEKHFKKEKKKLLKKMQTQHKEFVLSPEAEVIEALTRDKAILEEAFNIERFTLGRLYYMEMQDELDELLTQKMDDVEGEKADIVFKFNEDIADLLQTIAEKDEKEVELLKDKNALTRKMLALKKRTDDDGKKGEEGEIDDMKSEAFKLETIIPLKKEIAEIQRKRQQEHEANNENLKKAVDVIKNLLAEKAKTREGEKRRYSFASTGSQYESNLEDEDNLSGRESRISLKDSTVQQSNIEDQKARSNDPTPSHSRSMSSLVSERDISSPVKDSASPRSMHDETKHSREPTPNSARSQMLSPSRSKSAQSSERKNSFTNQTQESQDESGNQVNTPTPDIREDPIKTKEDLLEALKTLIDSAFIEEKTYESDTSSGAISDFESEPATPKPESDDGMTDSGAESVDNECLSIKKSDLELALNMERFGLGRVYYNEYRDSLQEAFKKLARQKEKNDILENKLNEGVKDLVNRTTFGKMSPVSTEAETQTGSDILANEVSAATAKKAPSDSQKDAKEEVNSGRIGKTDLSPDQNVGKDADSQPPAVKENILMSTTDERENMQNAETQTDFIENPKIHPAETAKAPKVDEPFTEDIQEARMRDLFLRIGDLFEREEEKEPVEERENQENVEKDKDEEEEKSYGKEKEEESQPENEKHQEKEKQKDGGTDKGDNNKEKHKDINKDQANLGKNAEKVEDPSENINEELFRPKDENSKQDENDYETNSASDEVPREDLEDESINDEEDEMDDKEIEGSSDEIPTKDEEGKGSENDEKSNSTVSNNIDDTTKDHLQEYEKLKNNYNILKALVGKGFVEEIPELKEAKAIEDNNIIDESDLKELIEEEKNIETDITSIDKQIATLKNMSDSNVREAAKNLNDKELVVLKELEGISNALKNEEDKEFIEHLKKERDEVDKKLKEMEKDLEENINLIGEDEKGLLDMTSKKIDLESEVAKKAQDLDKNIKKLKKLQEKNDDLNLQEDIANFKNQSAALNDLLESRFSKPYTSEDQDPTNALLDDVNVPASPCLQSNKVDTNPDESISDHTAELLKDDTLNPKARAILKEMFNKDLGAAKAAKKLRQTQRERDRYRRMVQDQADRLKPFLKKQESLQHLLDKDNKEGITETSSSDIAPSSDREVQETEQTPSNCKEKVKEGNGNDSENNSQENSELTDLDQDAIKREFNDSNENLSKVRNEIEALSDKALKRNYDPRGKSLSDRIQELEIKAAEICAQIDEVKADSASGKDHEDVYDTLKEKAVHELNCSELLSILPEDFEFVPEDVQSLFRLACLKDDLENQIKDLEKAIDEEETCFQVARTYNREGTLEEGNPKFHEVVQEKEKSLQELADISTQTADTLNEDKESKDVEYRAQKKTGLEQIVDSTQKVIKQEPVRAADRINNLIKLKHQKEHDLAQTTTQLIESKEEDLRGISTPISSTISSRCNDSKESETDKDIKDLENNIEKTASEISRLNQQCKDTESEEDTLAQLIELHKSLLRRPTFKEDTKVVSEAVLPLPSVVDELRSVKEDLKEIETKLDDMKDLFSEEEIEQLKNLESLIKAHHNIEKEKELFSELNDLDNNQKELQKRLSDNELKADLLSVKDVVAKKQKEIKRLEDNIKYLEFSLATLADDVNNNGDDETEFENTIKEALAEVQTKLEETEKERETSKQVRENEENELKDAITSLEDELEESREELEFLENELEDKCIHPKEDDGSLSPQLSHTIALLDKKKSLEEYLIEIDSKLSSVDSDKEPMEQAEIDSLRDKKREAEKKLSEIQEEKSKFEVELQEDEIQEMFNALCDEKKQLEDQRDELILKIRNGKSFSRMAHDMDDEKRPSDEDKKYYNHALKEMISGPKTLIQLAEENERLKDIACNQRSQIEDLNSRLTTSLGDQLSKAVLSLDCGKVQDIDTPIIDRINEGQKMEDIVKDLSNENKNLRNINEGLSKDLECLKDSIGQKLADFLINPDDCSSNVYLGPVKDVLVADGTIQEILEGQNNDIERAKEALGKNIAKVIMSPATEDRLNNDFSGVPQALKIMKDNDEDLETVLKAYEDELDLLGKENNVLKSMLGNDLAQTLLHLGSESTRDLKPSEKKPITDVTETTHDECNAEDHESAEKSKADEPLRFTKYRTNIPLGDRIEIPGKIMDRDSIQKESNRGLGSEIEKYPQGINEDFEVSEMKVAKNEPLKETIPLSHTRPDLSINDRSKFNSNLNDADGLASTLQEGAVDIGEGEKTGSNEKPAVKITEVGNQLLAQCGIEAPIRMTEQSMTLGEIIQGYESDLDTLKSKLGPGLYVSILDANKPYTRAKSAVPTASEDKLLSGHEEGKKEAPRAHGEIHDKMIKDQASGSEPNFENKDKKQGNVIQLENNDMKSRPSKVLDSQDALHDREDSHFLDSKATEDNDGGFTDVQDKKGREQLKEVEERPRIITSSDNLLETPQQKMRDKDMTLEDVLAEYEDKIELLGKENNALKSMLGNDLAQALLELKTGTKKDDLPSMVGSTSDDNLENKSVEDSELINNRDKAIKETVPGSTVGMESKIRSKEDNIKPNKYELSAVDDKREKVTESNLREDKRESAVDDEHDKVSESNLRESQSESAVNDEHHKVTESDLREGQKESMSDDERDKVTESDLRECKMKAPIRMAKDNRTLGDILNEYESDLDTLKSRLGPELYDCIMEVGKPQETYDKFGWTTSPEGTKSTNNENVTSEGTAEMADNDCRTIDKSVVKSEFDFEDKVEDKEKTLQSNRYDGKPGVQREGHSGDLLKRRKSPHNIPNIEINDVFPDNQTKGYVSLSQDNASDEVLKPPRQKMIDDDMTLEDVIEEYIGDLKTLKAQIGPELYKSLLASGRRQHPKDRDDPIRKNTQSISSKNARPTIDATNSGDNDHDIEQEMSSETPTRSPPKRDKDVEFSKSRTDSYDENKEISGVTSPVGDIMIQSKVPYEKITVKPKGNVGQQQPIFDSNSLEPGEITMNNFKAYDSGEVKPGNSDETGSIESGEIIDLDINLDMCSQYERDMLAPLQMKQQSKTLQEVVKGYEHDLQTLEEKLGPELFKGILDTKRSPSNAQLDRKGEPKISKDVFPGVKGQIPIGGQDEIPCENEQLEQKTHASPLIEQETPDEKWHPISSKELPRESKDKDSFSEPSIDHTHLDANKLPEEQMKESLLGIDTSTAQLSSEVDRKSVPTRLKATEAVQQPGKTLQDIITQYENELDILKSKLGPNLATAVLISESKKDGKDNNEDQSLEFETCDPAGTEPYDKIAKDRRGGQKGQIEEEKILEAKPEDQVGSFKECYVYEAKPESKPEDRIGKLEENEIYDKRIPSTQGMQERNLKSNKRDHMDNAIGMLEDMTLEDIISNLENELFCLKSKLGPDLTQLLLEDIDDKKVKIQEKPISDSKQKTILEAMSSKVLRKQDNHPESSELESNFGDETQKKYSQDHESKRTEKDLSSDPSSNAEGAEANLGSGCREIPIKIDPNVEQRVKQYKDDAKQPKSEDEGESKDEIVTYGGGVSLKDTDNKLQPKGDVPVNRILATDLMKEQNTPLQEVIQKYENDLSVLKDALGSTLSDIILKKNNENGEIPDHISDTSREYEEKEDKTSISLQNDEAKKEPFPSTGAIMPDIKAPGQLQKCEDTQRTEEINVQSDVDKDKARRNERLLHDVKPKEDWSTPMDSDDYVQTMGEPEQQSSDKLLKTLLPYFTGDGNVKVENIIQNLSDDLKTLNEKLGPNLSESLLALNTHPSTELPDSKSTAFGASHEFNKGNNEEESELNQSTTDPSWEVDDKSNPSHLKATEVLRKPDKTLEDIIEQYENELEIIKSKLGPNLTNAVLVSNKQYQSNEEQTSEDETCDQSLELYDIIEKDRDSLGEKPGEGFDNCKEMKATDQRTPSTQGLSETNLKTKKRDDVEETIQMLENMTLEGIISNLKDELDCLKSSLGPDLTKILLEDNKIEIHEKSDNKETLFEAKSSEALDQQDKHPELSELESKGKEDELAQIKYDDDQIGKKTDELLANDKGIPLNDTDTKHQSKGDLPVRRILATELMKQQRSPLQNVIQAYESDLSVLKNALGPTLSDMILKKHNTNGEIQDGVSETDEHGEKEPSTDPSLSAGKVMLGETKLDRADQYEDLQSNKAHLDDIKHRGKADKRGKLLDSAEVEQEVQIALTDSDDSVEKESEAIKDPVQHRSDTLQSTLLPYFPGDGKTTVENIIQDLSNDLRALNEKLGPNLKKSLLSISNQPTAKSIDPQRTIVNVSQEHSEGNNEENLHIPKQLLPKMDNNAEKKDKDLQRDISEEKLQESGSEGVGPTIDDKYSPSERDKELKSEEAEAIDLEAVAHMAENDQTLEEIIKHYEDTLDRYECALGPHLSQAILSTEQLATEPESERKQQTKCNDTIDEPEQGNEKAKDIENEGTVASSESPNKLSSKERGNWIKFVFNSEMDDEFRLDDPSLKEPIRFLNEGKTIEDMLMDLENDRENSKSLQSDDGIPQSKSDITEAYKKEIEELKTKNNEMLKDMNTLDAKLGSVLFNKLKDRQPSDNTNYGAPHALNETVLKNERELKNDPECSKVNDISRRKEDGQTKDAKVVQQTEEIEKALNKPIALIDGGKTVQDMLIDGEKDRNILGSIQSKDGVPISIDDITDAYKKKIEQLEGINTTVQNDLALLDGKIGEKLSNQLRGRPRGTPLRDHTEGLVIPDSQNLRDEEAATLTEKTIDVVTSDETIPHDANVVTYDKEIENQVDKRENVEKEYIKYSSLEAPIIMEQLEQTLEEVIADYETQLKEMLTNQEQLKTELDTLEQSIGPKLFKELCELNIQEVDDNKESQQTKDEKQVENEPQQKIDIGGKTADQIKIQHEKSDFEAINKMAEEDKPLSSILDDYQGKCHLLEKENESLKNTLSDLSGDVDVGQLISNYEKKIQMLENDNKEAQKEFENKHSELQTEIDDLKDTLEKLAQTLRQDFLDDLMKQQDSENRIQALHKMEKENKTLAEVVEEYEDNMKRLEREKAVLEQVAGQGEDGASMLDAINDYEDAIQNLKDVNKMLNKRIDTLSGKLGPKLSDDLIKLSEMSGKDNEKLKDDEVKDWLPVVMKMKDSNDTLEEVLACYENKERKSSSSDEVISNLKDKIGEPFIDDINGLDNQTIEQLQEKDKRPIALLIMKKRNENLGNIIKLYEDYLLKYGVLDALQGETLASELEEALEEGDIAIDVQNEALVSEIQSETLTSGYNTLFGEDFNLTGAMPVDSHVKDDSENGHKNNQLEELQKQLQEEKELKEKYQKDVEELLNDIVQLKLKNANDDEDKEDIEKQIREELNTKQENQELKEELADVKKSNSELQKDNDDLTKEKKDMQNEIRSLEKKILELETKNEELEKEIEDIKSQLKENAENFKTEKGGLDEDTDQKKKDKVEDLLRAKEAAELKLQEQLILYRDLEEKFNGIEKGLDKDGDEKFKELKIRNESLKDQLDLAEESMKEALEKYQEQIRHLEIENAKTEEEKKHEIEILNNKLDLEKTAYEKLKEDYNDNLKKEKDKMQSDFDNELEREKRRSKKDLEEQTEDLDRLKKRHEQELNDLNLKSKKEKFDLDNLFEEQKQQLQREFDDKMRKEQEDHEKELESLREALEEKMIAEKAELNVHFNQEKTALQAQIEKDIYGEEIQKNLDLENNFQGTLNQVLKDHASEIENIDREMKQADEYFKEQKYKLLEEFEKEREKDKQEQQRLRFEMESNIENMLKEIIKLKHQRKEMRHQHRLEKQAMEELFDRERNEIQESIEQSKNELLTKFKEDHEKELGQERENYEGMLNEIKEALDKSEAKRKELEEKLHNEELKIEESKLNNAQTRPLSPEVQKEIKVIKRKFEVEYEQKLSVEKQRFEETLQGLRREVGTLQEKRKIIQERVYNQEGGYAAEKHVIEKSIANYKMEVLAKLEGEMAQRMNRERKPLEEEIKELQTENEELKRQRWEMKIQFRREKSTIEEKYEKEKESMEQNFNTEREEMRKRLEATLQKQDKMNKVSGGVLHGETLSSPRIDNTVRMLQQENLSLVTQNARLEADVEKLSEKLESIEGNFKEMIEFEKNKAERVKKIQEEIPKTVSFKDKPEHPAPEYHLPSSSSQDDTMFHRLQEQDHQIHQLLETKRYYESVLGELCDEAGLFELDRNEVV